MLYCNDLLCIKETVRGMYDMFTLELDHDHRTGLHLEPPYRHLSRLSLPVRHQHLKHDNAGGSSTETRVGEFTCYAWMTDDGWRQSVSS